MATHGPYRTGGGKHMATITLRGDGVKRAMRSAARGGV